MAVLARYISGNDVVVRFTFENFLPIRAEYSVLDQAGNVIVALTPVASLRTASLFDDPTIEITVNGEHNTLSDAVKGLRTVTLVITDAENHISTLVEHYALITSSTLSVPAESLLTLEEAMLVMMDVPNVAGVEEADSYERRRGLIEASRRICSIRLTPTKGSDQFTDFDWGGESVFINQLSRDQFYALPSAFLNDVRIAAVCEANDVLGGNPNEQARREGILSESVGETTNMYQSGRPPEERLGTRAYRLLSKYITRSYKVAR